MFKIYHLKPFEVEQRSYERKAVLAIYLILKFKWGQESWFKDKVSDALSLILMYSAIFVVSILIPLITPPVTIELILPNKHYPEKNETRFSIRRGRPSRIGLTLKMLLV